MTKRASKRWKVPLPIKLAMGIIGTIFILIAVVGTLVHGQTNMTSGTNATTPTAASTSGIPQSAAGCIGHDQTTGKTYIDVRCLSDPSTTWILCNNWPGGNATLPMGINCGWANQTSSR